jgi:SAM-dependent methyltransferase
VSGWLDPRAAAAWDSESDASPTRGLHLDLLLDVLQAFAPARVLELGIGTGRVAEAVLERTSAHVVGVDSSPAMLDIARTRLERFGDRVELVEADLSGSSWLRGEPANAIVTVQTLHHLPNGTKATVLRRLARVLADDGIVLMRDKVTVPEELFDAFRVVWRRQPTPMPETPAAYDEELRTKGDQPASLVDQLAWLREGGLEPAVLHVEAHYALFVARFPTSRRRELPRGASAPE